MERERAIECLKGGYDLHVHSAPSHFNRIVDDFELARDADKYEMDGIVIKCHYEPTAARAEICNKYAGLKKTKVFGAITLNHPVGGINPFAVESAAKMGASIAWMPTCDSKHNLNFSKVENFRERPGVTILDENRKLLPQLYEIFEIAKEFSLCIGTGHLSTEESVLLCKEGIKNGVKMMLTHPDWKTIRTPLETQVELSEKGVIIEKSWVPVHMGDAVFEEFANSIKIIGPKNIILTTDFGASFLKKTPVEGMIDCIEALLDFGIERREIDMMVKENPKKILINS